VKREAKERKTMGTLPRLKKKDELRYRKGSTNESINCRYCVNFVKEYEAKGIGGVVLRVEGRCQIMGVDHSSIRYRIRRDFTCDAHKYNGK
jgi:hypothetical protein